MWQESVLSYADRLTADSSVPQCNGGGHYKIYLPNGRIKFEDGTERSTSPAFGSIVLELGKHVKTNEVVPIDLATIIGK